MKNILPRMSVALLVVFSLCGLPSRAADSARVGTIEGRVFNPATGEYLENVRMSVDGTTLDTLTDASGQYRLTDVPPGAVRVRASRTGTAGDSATVEVVADRVSRRDFNLSVGRADSADTGPIKLDQFVVKTSREMDGAAVAINTKRVAPNVINVVSADEFGPVSDDNVGEVMKTIPGVNIGLGTGGDPFTVSLNGVPANNVPITMGGFNLAKASSGTSRTVGLENVAINNLSRIEVVYTPTPETTGSALAGTVNMVPRSAFERSHPAYTLSTALTMRDNDRSFNKTPGPRRWPERKVLPSVDFSAVVPVNDRFGFTLSGSASILYTPDEFTQMTWAGVATPTNGAAFPNTTPDKPYLSSYIVRDYTKRTKHNSIGATIDYKLSRNDRVSLSFQYGFSDFDGIQHTLTFFTNGAAAGGFSPEQTRGLPGAGEVRTANLGQKTGGFYYMPNLAYRHDGPVWKAEVGLGMSRANRILKDLERGYFNNAQARRTGVTVSFLNNDTLRPGAITVTDATGAAVNPYVLGSYTLNTATSNALDAWDLQQNAFANLRREFHGVVPFTVKAGYDFQHMVKDIRRDSPTFTFAGANANASQVLDESFSTRTAPYGFPAIQWMSNEQLFDLYRANPALFTVNETNRYTANVGTSKHADEAISSLYARGDVQFFNGRLKFTGGLRGEQTNAKGEGALIDPTRNYQRAANGSFVLVNGRPTPITTNALDAARLTNVDRGLHAEKEYLRLFPSLNASYNVRENLVARAGYYWSVGRPDLNQYAGSLTLPDTQSLPSPTNVITVNNVAIKAWSARTVKASLEYYFENVGLISLSGFSREIKNFFGSTRFRATPDFLDHYNLSDATYGGYDVVTQYNLPKPVRMTGIDFSYKQALTFLPSWAQGVQVFVNGSAQRTTGDDSANFAGYIPRTLNAGASLSRTKYILRVKWNYQSRARLGPVASGTGIEPGTFNWSSPRALLDVSGDYFFTRHWSLFANLNNITDAAVGLEIAGPNTPKIAQFRQRERFGSMWTFGVKASF